MQMGNEKCPKKALYAAYTDYCRALKYPVLPDNTFHKKPQSEVRVEQIRPSMDGHRVYAWAGIAWNVSTPGQSYISVHDVHDVRVKIHLRYENTRSKSVIRDDSRVENKGIVSRRGFLSGFWLTISRE
jgi:hypothetical protein